MIQRRTISERVVLAGQSSQVGSMRENGLRIRIKDLQRWWAMLFLCVLAGVAMFATQLFGAPLIGSEFATFIAALLLVGSLWGFVRFGGRVITPISIIFLAFAINLGFPAVFTALTRGHEGYEVATSLGLLFVLIALSLTKHRLPAVPTMSLKNRRSVIRPGVFAAVVLGLYSVFLALYLYEPLFATSWQPVIGSFPAAFAVAAFLALAKKRRVLFVVLGIACLGSIAIYLNVAFDYFGRLNVVALLLAVVIIVSWVRPNWVYKVTILVAAPVGLVWAGLHRAIAGGEGVGFETGRYVLEAGSGLGSILAPFTTLAEIVARSDLFGMRPATEWVDQLTFTLFFWVPRVWWPEKPEGFGRVMVYELRPGLSNTGHSMAASIYGEFVYYVGVVGPLAGTLLVIAFTRLFVSAQEWTAKSRSSIWMIYYVLLAYMLAQAITLVWGGLAAYAVRGFAPVFGFAGVFLSWWILRNGLRVRSG